MEITVKLIKYIFMLCLLACPAVSLYFINKKELDYEFSIYFAISILIGSVLLFTSAWWGDFSNELLLHHFGLEFGASNPFENVKAENLPEAKRRLNSYMGIGWPLKAIIAYLIYVPYILFVYITSLAIYWINSKIKS